MELTTRAAVAAALADAGGQGVSGEALAREFGVSRVAVGKHVAALRELGFAIHAEPRVGYRIVSAPDLCIPETVTPLVRDPLWVRCEGGAETGSTNDDAKRLARAGAPAGTVVVAARQTGGRGRFGRVWSSPEGGAYLSAVLRPATSPTGVAPLSLVAALGVARALGRLGCDAGLKWPNDVWLGDVRTGGKLAGVLLEMAAEADTVEWVVIGCGVNVAPSDVPGSACVRDVVSGARIPDVAAAVLDELAAVVRRFVADGFGPLAEEYRRRGVLWGEPVVVRDATGATVAEGTAESVDETGALLVRDTGGVRAVAAGEVTLRGGGRPTGP